MYLGLVINNNDPEYRGRIQVFIPHIMPALYENWNKEGKDISISCIGDNLESSLSSDVVLKLQKILPWAEAASPIIGSSSPGGVLQSIGDAVGSFVGGVKNFFSQTPTANPTVGPMPNVEVTNEAAAAADASSRPWSAAFISYVGKSADPNFPGATLHTSYANSIKQGKVPGWSALNPNNTQIQPGDIVIKNRGGNGLSYNSSWQGSSHGDIVTSVSEGEIRAVGGNVSNSVTNVKIDPNSTFAILRPPPAVAQKMVQTAQQEQQRWSQGGWKEGNPSSWSALNSYWQATGSSLPGVKALEESNSSAIPPQPNFLVKPDGPQGSEPQVATAPSTSIQAGGPEAGLSGTISGGGTTSSLIKPELIVSGAQATRYGFIGDPYQNSNDRKVGNAGNPVHTGMVALSPELRKQYNLVNGDVIALKKGNSVTYGVVGNQTASNLPTTGGGPSGRRVDFLDLNNELKDIDGLGDLYVINRGPKRTGKGLEGQEATNYATEQYYKTLELAKTGQIDFENAVINNTQTQGILPETPPSVVNNTFGHGRTIQKNTNDMAKGLFAFPNTGAMVWVFFREGNPLFPVYFAASYSSTEWQSAYRGSSINASGTNTGNPSPNEISNSAQMNFNSAGGIEATEVINASDPTKTKKVLMVHGPDGSNRAFTPGFAQDYIKGNFLQHVDSNSFRITHGYEEKWVEADSNYNIRGNHIVKVGKFDQEAIDAMKALSDMSYEINQTLKSSKS